MGKSQQSNGDIASRGIGEKDWMASLRCGQHNAYTTIDRTTGGYALMNPSTRSGPTERIPRAQNNYLD